MRRTKAWVLLASGAFCFLLGLLSVLSDAFDWNISIGGGFDVPQSLVLAGVFVLGGGILFANGLLALDPPPQPSTGEGEPQRGSRR